MTRITEEKVQNYCENIVIGNGIMAKQLMFELKDHYSDISCISSLDFAPASSLSTTSINCLRGTKKGVSHLGDLLYDSQKEFIAFYEKYNPPGISKTIEVQTWLEGAETHAKWLRRYGQYKSVMDLKFSTSRLKKTLACVEVEAYIIDSDIFFKWYQSQLEDIHFYDEFIVSVIKVKSSYELLTKSGKVYKCKRLFLCTSYMSNQFLDICIDNSHKLELTKQKKVYGSYLSHNVDIHRDYGLDFSKSFSLSYNFTRLIYRKSSNQLLISMSDINKNSFLNDIDYVSHYFDEITEILELNKLPGLASWSLKQGIRSKGFKRFPFFKQVNKNLFIISGLYKNAFSFAFLISKNILHTIDK